MIRSLLLSAALLLGASAFAQVNPSPTVVNFQGRLSAATGKAVPDGTYSVRFSLWDLPSGGVEQWNITRNVTASNSGLVAVQLTDLPSKAFNSDTWLEVKVGDDPAMTPRVQMVTVPHAFTADAVKDGGVTSAALAPDAVDSSRIQNGVITAADMAPGVLNFWGLSGNAGTNPTTNFLGTTDLQPLNFRVNNTRALRMESVNAIDGANTFQGVNILGGFSGNLITTGVTAATIAGGGVILNTTNAFTNSVTDVGGTVGGGASNRAGDAAGTVASANYATVSGGFGNKASGSAATVAGGVENEASGPNATVGGGRFNVASGTSATVPGGSENEAVGLASFAAGNRAKANHNGSFVWADGQAADFASTGPNQFLVRAADGVSVVSNAAVSTTVGDGAFKIVNSTGTAALQFDTNDILCLGSSVFSLNGSNTCETRINSTVFIATNHHVGIGDGDPLFRLELPNVASEEGRGRAQDWVTYSSGRWKQNVHPIRNALEKVTRIHGVTFDWKPEYGGTHDIGFVAEDVGRVVPELATWEADGHYASGLKYGKVTALTVEAIKEQQQQIARLQQQNADLQARNARLEARLAAIESQLGRGR